MANKYTKHREKVQKRYKIKKATTGVVMPEKVPEGNGFDIASGTASGATAGASMGKALGPQGAAIGAGVGALYGLGKGLYDKRQAKITNRESDRMEAAYKEHGGKATDPKLQMSQAKRGKSKYKKSKLIEIEGKNGVGEIHTDKNFKVKTIGKTPHKKGKYKKMSDPDVINAKEGDIVFNTQGKPNKYQKIKGLIEKKEAGDKSAEIALEKERQKLPSDDEAKKANGDSEILAEEEFPEEIVPQLTQGDENTIDIPGEATTEAEKARYITENIKYTDSKGQERTMNYDENDPQLKKFLDIKERNPGDHTQEEWQKIMKDEGVNYKEISALANSTFGEGTTGTAGWGEDDNRNIQGMSSDFLNNLGTPGKRQVNVDSKDIDRTPELVKEAEAAEGNREMTPVKLPEEAAAEGDTTVDEDATTPEKNKSEFDANALLNKSNIGYNYLRSKGAIEDYDMKVPKYQRYKHEDLTAPLMAQADKQSAVNKYNIQGGHGSRGQQTSAMTQSDSKILDAKHKVQTDEIGRRLGNYNQNVGLSNMEVNAATQEAQKRRDTLRGARAKRRSYEAASVKESVERADVDRQEGYMRSRDRQLMDRDNAYMKFLRSNNYETTGNAYNADGSIGDVNTGYNKKQNAAWEKEEAERKALEAQQAGEAKRKGSKGIKVKKSRYTKK